MFHPKGPSFLELAEQALSSTDHGYDLLAPKFDYTPFRTPDAVLDEAISHIGPPQSVDDALDLACGTGAALRFLRPLCRSHVVGLDRSRGMLEKAREQLSASSGTAGGRVTRALEGRLRSRLPLGELKLTPEKGCRKEPAHQPSLQWEPSSTSTS